MVDNVYSEEMFLRWVLWLMGLLVKMFDNMYMIKVYVCKIHIGLSLINWKKGY